MEENAPKPQSTILERLKEERRQLYLKKGDILADLDKALKAEKERLLVRIEEALTVKRDNNIEEEIISIELSAYELGISNSLDLVKRGVIGIEKYRPLSKKSMSVIIKEYMKSNSLATVFVGGIGQGACVKYPEFLAELQEQGLSPAPGDAPKLIVTANLRLEEEQQTLALEP